MIEAVARGEVDFAVVGRLSMETTPDLVATPIAREEVCVAAGAQHPVFSKAKRSLQNSCAIMFGRCPRTVTPSGMDFGAVPIGRTGTARAGHLKQFGSRAEINRRPSSSFDDDDAGGFRAGGAAWTDPARAWDILVARARGRTPHSEQPDAGGAIAVARIAEAGAI